MRTRDESIQIVTLCAGSFVVAVTTLSEVLGGGKSGFSVLQFLGMVAGIFLCSLTWLIRFIPTKALLFFGATLLATTAGTAAMEWAGLNTVQQVQQVTWLVQQELNPPDPLGIYRKDSVFGWSHKPGTVGHHSNLDFNVYYTIDDEGCRKIPEAENPRGTIHFLGCSNTFGQGVADNECYPAVLAGQYWKNYRVKNHAVSGYGTTQAYLELRELLKQPDRPAMVLYGWISHHAMRNYRRASGNSDSEDSGAFSPLIELENGRLVVNGLIASNEADWPESEKLRKAEFEITVHLLTEMNAMCRERDVPFFLVSLPDRYAKLEINRAVFDALRSHDLAIIDAWESRDDYFTYDCHPKASWHASLAKRLANDPMIKAIIP